MAAYKRPIRADDRRTAKQRRKEKERREEVCSLNPVTGYCSSVLCSVCVCTSDLCTVLINIVLFLVVCSASCREAEKGS